MLNFEFALSNKAINTTHSKCRTLLVVTSVDGSCVPVCSWQLVDRGQTTANPDTNKSDAAWCSGKAGEATACDAGIPYEC